MHTATLLFSDGMKMYSDSKVSEFLGTMDDRISVSFQNDWNKERNHRERITFRTTPHPRYAKLEISGW